MKLAKALEEKVMDVRLMDRLLAEGKISKSQVDEYISKLEDDADNFVAVDEKSHSEE